MLVLHLNYGVCQLVQIKKMAKTGYTATEKDLVQNAEFLLSLPGRCQTFSGKKESQANTRRKGIAGGPRGRLHAEQRCEVTAETGLVFLWRAGPSRCTGRYRKKIFVKRTRHAIFHL